MTTKGWIILGAVALSIILLSSLGAMLGLVAGAGLAYLGWRQATLSEAVVMKVLWWVVLVIGVLVGISSLPGMIGVVALYLLLKLYDKWKETKDYSYDKF
ncbi:lmo0954 family membrane protein [Shouchella lehensis]|uniref:Uncharacterized protein n=2 Tax=Shouchella lehensis TaxID=300825 RepID=A0A060LQ84_9BACI|nr:hypothetical protein [Shouchella lehensis]AIC93461.1 hypothetical protein BleG1_0853 [Shouchella lehensis G1]MBG9782825.1 hypothetical protein [Shouchella lehensis]RQW23007.1 hypothetical protein EH196_04140 [Bacillus sp. C1-1]TES49831.1 hypothetical protein E2L03_10300 [Shouchella lehensis]